jgi:hypothetical protein
MQRVWLLTRFYQDPEHPDPNHWIPFAASYGGQWVCPQYPADPSTGWALIEMLTTPHQQRAMLRDPRIKAVPKLYGSKKIPSELLDAYKGVGATPNMTTGDLFELLEETVHPDFSPNKHHGGGL